MSAKTVKMNSTSAEHQEWVDEAWRLIAASGLTAEGLVEEQLDKIHGPWASRARAEGRSLVMAALGRGNDVRLVPSDAI